MTTTGIVLVILFFYACVLVLYGILAARRKQDFRDVISASGQTTPLMLAGSFIAGQIGSGFIIGGAQYGAIYGIGGAWYGIACAMTGVISAALARFILSRDFLTLSDYFAQRYKSVTTRLIYCVSTIFAGLSLVAGQLLAARAIFQTLGISPVIGVTIVALIGLFYANVAGLWGSMKISTVQSVMIFAGLVIAISVSLSQNGLHFLWENLPASYFQPKPFDTEFLVSITVPILLASCVSQFTFQAVHSARSLQAARWGYLLAAAGLLPISFIPPLLGMYGRALFPKTASENVFTALVLERLPIFVAALILSAIICAVVISCNTGYLMVGTIAAHDIYKGMIRPEADDRVCRAVMFCTDAAVFIIGVFLALRLNDIIQILSVGYGLVSSGCLVPFLGGLLWKRGSAKGALLSAAVGMLATLADAFAVIRLPYACLTSILLSAVAYIIGSLLFKNH